MSDKDEAAFDEHLEHFRCEWCQQSYADQHRALIASEKEKSVTIDNLHGTIRSYKIYQQAILAENRDYKNRIAYLESQLARVKQKKVKR